MFLKPTEVRSIAPTVVVMLPEALTLQPGAAFERMAGRVFQKGKYVSLQVMVKK